MKRLEFRETYTTGKGICHKSYHCEYCDQEDQIMLCIKDKTLQEKLVNAEKITAGKAIAIATTYQSVKSVTIIWNPSMASSWYT